MKPTAQEARGAAQRLINSHFGKPDQARMSIPTRPDKDDDCIIMAYIDHAEKRIKELEDALENMVSYWETAHIVEPGWPDEAPKNAKELLNVKKATETETTPPAISKNGDGLEQGWEYYRKGNRLIRIKRPITETRIGDGQWQPAFLDLSDDILISSEQNGWKRVEGGEKR